MKCSGAAFVLCAAILGNGCSKSASDSVVYVTVTAPAGLPPVTQLRVNLAYAGETDIELFPRTNSTTPISFSSGATFVLELPHSSSGTISIAIDALNSVGGLVSHGESAVPIVTGGQTNITVVLGTGNDGDAGVMDSDASDSGVSAETANIADSSPRDSAFGDLGVADGTTSPVGAGGTSGDTGTGDASPFSGGGIIGSTGGIGTGGVFPSGGVTGAGGIAGMGGVTSAGGTVGTGGSSVVPPSNTCGNGVVEPGELCDCGTDSTRLPTGCKAVNGLFYGDGKGCSKTCTKEPTCQDSSGKTQACTSACGDGNIDPGEDCDDGNLADGDGCSSQCKIEDGFTCTTTTEQDSSTCQSGSGQCLELPVTYRDFQPENVASGGHPDFFFLGTKKSGSTSPTTICVPNSGGPSNGNDSTARCWGIMADTLSKGKPQPGTTKTCACQFSDWNIANSSRIPGNYTQAGNDSPLSDGAGNYLGGAAGSAVSVTGNAGVSSGTITGYTASTPGGPVWAGTTPAYKDANSFNQWFNDDSTVNETFTGVIEMTSIGTNIYQYASKSHLATGGFFPLDTLNASQATLCNLMPYWNHGNGNAIWTTCTGDQYLFPPRVTAADCPTGASLTDGCWVTAVPGVKHDFYFTTEARYYFAYDGATGVSLSFYADDDLFIFINGQLVLDLGGVHQQLPGKVTVNGEPGDATYTAGGCLDATGNQIGAVAGSTACTVTNNGKTSPAAVTPDDFKAGTVKLGLVTGKVYEIAIFGANRHPPDSDFQLTLSGYTTKRSVCHPN